MPLWKFWKTWTRAPDKYVRLMLTCLDEGNGYKQCNKWVLPALIDAKKESRAALPAVGAYVGKARFSVLTDSGCREREKASLIIAIDDWGNAEWLAIARGSGGCGGDSNSEHKPVPVGCHGRGRVDADRGEVVLLASSTGAMVNGAAPGAKLTLCDGEGPFEVSKSWRPPTEWLSANCSAQQLPHGAAATGTAGCAHGQTFSDLHENGAVLKADRDVLKFSSGDGKILTLRQRETEKWLQKRWSEETMIPTPPF
jgi:hypothetical protein